LKYSVEPAYARKPRAEGDLGDGQSGFRHQPAREVHATGLCNGYGRGAKVFVEETAYVASRHSQGTGEVVHRTFVEESIVDES